MSDFDESLKPSQFAVPKDNNSGKPKKGGAKPYHKPIMTPKSKGKNGSSNWVKRSR